MNDAGQPRATTAAKRAAEARAALALYGAVAVGSVIGSVARWGVSIVLAPQFPWATLFANATGSFAIGFFARLSGPDGRLFVGARTRQFVMTGLCGGYTTFSIFSLEALRLAEDSALQSGLYVAGSAVLWFASVWAGDVLASRINRLRGASA
jgi:CrcB protein